MRRSGRPVVGFTASIVASNADIWFIRSFVHRRGCDGLGSEVSDFVAFEVLRYIDSMSFTTGIHPRLMSSAGARGNYARFANSTNLEIGACSLLFLHRHHRLILYPCLYAALFLFSLNSYRADRLQLFDPKIVGELFILYHQPHSADQELTRAAFYFCLIFGLLSPFLPDGRKLTTWLKPKIVASFSDFCSLRLCKAFSWLPPGVLSLTMRSEHTLLRLQDTASFLLLSSVQH